MIDSLAALDSFEGVFGPLKIDRENREIAFELFLVKIEDGKAVYWQED